MTPLHKRVLSSFGEAYGGLPVVVVRAPGRVNLIGEHTDYNDGFVLPCAIDYETRVAASPREDARVRVVAADCHQASDEFRVDAPIAARPGMPWANYVRGVVAMLQKHGVALRGAELAIAGNVPQGAGLSSSAALEVAVLQALNTLHDLKLDATQIARLAQRSENEFVGCQCGIMDQLVSARGRAGHVLLIDCRSLEARPVPLPPGMAVMIVHSGVARGLVDSLAQLEAGAAGLDPLVRRRARHVVSENQRTLDAADALAAGDASRLGHLMAASHASMRDDFEITVHAVDRLVEIAQRAIGEHGGARMTGGGFGGCVVALLPTERAAEVQSRIVAEYSAPNGKPASVWICSACDGAGVVHALPAGGA
jgi:galactokinase